MIENEPIRTDSATVEVKESPEVNLSGKSAEDLREMKEELETMRKSHFRWLVLRGAFEFLLLVGALVAPSFLVHEAFGSLELGSGSVVMAVIGGILGLLLSVGFHEFLDTRQRRLNIRNLRISEKQFFEKIRRDLSLRLTEKVR